MYIHLSLNKFNTFSGRLKYTDNYTHRYIYIFFFIQFESSRIIIYVKKAKKEGEKSKIKVYNYQVGVLKDCPVII